jgi:prolyl 4-hydroxylase
MQTRQPHPQSVTPELREWISAQARAGCRAGDIVRAMCDSGWDDAVAHSALREVMPDTAADAPHRTLPQALPGPDLRTAPPQLLPDGIGGPAVPLLAALNESRVLLFGSLLSDAECDALMALAGPRLARSETVDHRSGASEVNAARTSQGMFFERGETPLIEGIEKRIGGLLNWPVAKGEGLQVLRYEPGAEYLPHYDYFDPAMPGTPAVLQRGGQRLATLIIYLNTPESGGATVFPDLGLEVAPIKGNAVFFSYAEPHPKTRTLHGGAPVGAGEKWVATKWLREGLFD